MATHTSGPFTGRYVIWRTGIPTPRWFDLRVLQVVGPACPCRAHRFIYRLFRSHLVWLHEVEPS
jgi:hypothetical protein